MFSKVGPGCLRCHMKSKALFVCHLSMEPGWSRTCEKCWIDTQECSLSLSRGLWVGLDARHVGDRDIPEALHLYGLMSSVVKLSKNPRILPKSMQDIVEMISALEKWPWAMQLLENQSEEKPGGPKKRPRLGKHRCHLAGDLSHNQTN